MVTMVLTRRKKVVQRQIMQVRIKINKEGQIRALSKPTISHYLLSDAIILFRSVYVKLEHN
jgi:hypothetical protein